MFLLYFISIIMLIFTNSNTIERFNTKLDNQKYIITLKPYTNKGTNNNLSFIINRNSIEINKLHNKIQKFNSKLIKVGLEVNKRYKTFSNSNNSVNHGINKLNNI